MTKEAQDQLLMAARKHLNAHKIDNNLRPTLNELEKAVRTCLSEAHAVASPDVGSRPTDGPDAFLAELDE